MSATTNAEIRRDDRIVTMDANLQQFLEFSKAHPGAPLPWDEWAAAMILAIANDIAMLEALLANER